MSWVWRKQIPLSIIFLFIGVSLAPAITANIETIPKSKELVDVTIDFYGLDETNSQTISFTREQATELEKLLRNLQVRLDTAESNEETIAIFQDTINSLDILELLGDLSVDEAQRLILGQWYIYRLFQMLGKISDRQSCTIERNIPCLVSGECTEVQFVGLVGSIAVHIRQLMVFLDRKIDYFHSEPIFLLIYAFAEGIELSSIVLNKLLPLQKGSYISFGCSTTDMGLRDHYYPSKGWICISGLAGIQMINGSFYGAFFSTGDIMEMKAISVGASGFVGLKIKINDKCFFIGTALRVEVSRHWKVNNRPWPWCLFLDP
jgi:hypothetical protein